jgi:uncharacterized membrane protein YoaK (UPF0700 family)
MGTMRRWTTSPSNVAAALAAVLTLIFVLVTGRWPQLFVPVLVAIGAAFSVVLLVRMVREWRQRHGEHR